MVYILTVVNYHPSPISRETHLAKRQTRSVNTWSHKLLYFRPFLAKNGDKVGDGGDNGRLFESQTNGYKYSDVLINGLNKGFFTKTGLNYYLFISSTSLALLK